MINNTIQNTYSSLLKPNPRAINPMATPAQSALSGKINGGTPTPFAFGGGASRGTGTTSVIPATTVHPKTTGLISPGAYKGVQITPGSDAAIQAQIAKIDTPPSTTAITPPPIQTTASVSSPITSPTTGTGNAGLVTSPTTSTSQPTGNGTPTYAGLVGNIANIGNNGSQGYTDAINVQNQLKQNIAEKYGDIESTAIPLNFQQGREQVLARQYASQLDAAQQAVNQQQTQQTTQLGALNSAAGLAAPQQYGLTTQPFNPLTGQFEGGGTGGAVGRAIQASNIGTAQDFQSKIQQTQAQASSADANFNILNSIASQGGVTGDSPILSGLLQRFGQTVGGQDAPAVAQFKAQLQAVRQAWSTIVGGDANQAIPDNVTAAQLAQIQQTLKSTAQNNVAGLQNQLDDLQNGGSSNTNSNGNTKSKSVWEF